MFYGDDPYPKIVHRRNESEGACDIDCHTVG